MNTTEPTPTATGTTAPRRPRRVMSDEDRRQLDDLCRLGVQEIALRKSARTKAA